MLDGSHESFSDVFMFASILAFVYSCCGPPHQLVMVCSSKRSHFFAPTRLMIENLKPPRRSWHWHGLTDQFEWLTWGQCRKNIPAPWSLWACRYLGLLEANVLKPSSLKGLVRLGASVASPLSSA